MKLKRPEFLFVGFAVALALLGGVAWFGWRHTAHMQETAALVAHTERERDAWARLVLLIERVQGEQRGYLLTGEPAFLKSFEASLKSVEEQQRLLAQLVKDAEQKANLSTLKPLLAERIAFARRNVDRRQNAGFEAAAQELLTLKGKNLTDQIAAQVARIDARSQALLDQRAAQAGREASTSFLLGVTGTGLSFALLITVFALVLRENRLRQRAEAQLRDLFDGTNDIIQSVAPDGRILFVNRAWLNTLGYRMGELAGLNTRYVAPRDAGALRERSPAEIAKVIWTAVVPEVKLCDVVQLAMNKGAGPAGKKVAVSVSTSAQAIKINLSVAASLSKFDVSFWICTPRRDTDV